MTQTGLKTDHDGTTRCWWCGDAPLYIHYHDNEWGVPVDDDQRLFEKICLEGFQAGLSWLTILRKRENFRIAFADFDFNKVATYGEKEIERILHNKGIIRHRGKIEATINNAQRAQEMVKEFGSLARYFWRFEPEEKNRPSEMSYATLTQITVTDESKAMAKDLKKRGWKFVGPTTCYAFMQAMGLVNDHLEDCAFREKVEEMRKAFKR